jgi:hypothetical protein
MVLIPKNEYEHLLELSVKHQQQQNSSPDKIAETQAEQEYNELLLQSNSDANMEPDNVKLQKCNDGLRKLLSAKQKRNINSSRAALAATAAAAAATAASNTMSGYCDWMTQTVKSVPLRYQCKARALCSKLGQQLPTDFTFRTQM